MNALKRRELKAQETKQVLDLAKFIVDKAVDLVSNPAVSLVGGFTLVNLAENKVIGVTKNDRLIRRVNFWGTMFPQFIDEFTDTTIPAGTPLTLLTPDQANLARVALVALASGGLVSNLAEVLKK